MKIARVICQWHLVSSLRQHADGDHSTLVFIFIIRILKTAPVTLADISDMLTDEIKGPASFKCDGHNCAFSGKLVLISYSGLCFIYLFLKEDGLFILDFFRFAHSIG